MRVRKLDAGNDMTFGQGQKCFHRDTPDAVAQNVMTRLELYEGEYYQDRREGMPWPTQVLGKYTSATRDAAIRARILDTPGVTSLVDYSSTLDRNTRGLTVSARVNTVYGEAVLRAALNPAEPK